jgi:hypothetical protein
MVKKQSRLKDTKNQKKIKKKASHTGGKRVHENFGNEVLW